MHEEPPPPPQAPLPVRIARTGSALVMLPWPFIAIIAGVSLRSDPAGPLAALLASPWGLFRGLVVLYPLVIIPAFLSSRALLRAQRVWLSAAVALFPLLLFLSGAVLADVTTRMRGG